MKNSKTVEPTRFLKFEENEEIKVNNLPESLRYEVETLDEYNQERINILYELEKIELAIMAKKSQLREYFIQQNNNQNDKTDE